MSRVKIEIDSKLYECDNYQGKINVEFDADKDTTDLIIALIKKECPLFH